ncbi:MAG: phosphoribosylaminoimidazole carboxylase catalytic subunit [Acidobacteria bacterium OLB17]|nr:MAG: phosphoribosylaminoimidazole carboxylase catalytic subunit [Acidobacteria bacterium OLB17]
MKAPAGKRKSPPPIVSIIMGSKSDWPTMKLAADILEEFGVEHETKIVSAHRTPDLLFEFARSAEERGIEVIIAAPAEPLTCRECVLRRRYCQC